MKNSDFFGGFFDFNGDGETDFGERFIAYKMIDDFEKKAKEKKKQKLDYTDAYIPVQSGRKSSQTERRTFDSSPSQNLCKPP